jgi:TonB family protein
VSLKWTKDPALDISDASLVFVLGPLPSDLGLQLYRKHYYHRALDSAALAKGQLDFDVPTSVFGGASSAMAYLAHPSIPRPAAQADVNTVVRQGVVTLYQPGIPQPAAQAADSGSESEPGPILSNVYYSTDARGMTQYNLYLTEELAGGKKVTIHRTVYRFPSGMGAIEIKDIPGVETTVMIWTTAAGPVPTDIPLKVREKLEQTEGKRVSEVKRIDYGAVTGMGAGTESAIGVPPALAPAPQIPQPAGVDHAGGTFSPPVLLSRCEPVYTRQARNARVEGAVQLSVTVGPDGVPRELRVLRSLDAGLDRQAVEAVKAWRFQPGTKDGQPVSVTATIEVDFRLRNR